MKTDSTADTETSNAQKVNRDTGHISVTPALGSRGRKIRFQGQLDYIMRSCLKPTQQFTGAGGFSLGVEQLPKEGPGLGLWN